MPSPSLSQLTALEWRHGSRRATLGFALVAAALVGVSHLLLPLFPARAIDFMRIGFRLDDLAGVLVLNDLMAVYFPAFFVGLAGSLGAVLIAREEHRLELLLAKPVRAGDFVVARTVPALVATVLVGVAAALATGLAVAVHPGIGDSVGPLGAFGGGLFLTALALVLLAAVQQVFVRIRDPFLGLLVGCMIWLLTCMPTAVLLYRPDLFAGRDALAAAIVSSSLLWHQAAMIWLGPLALLLALPLAWALVRSAGARLGRADAL